MINLEIVPKLKKGDMIVLRDFHTVSAMGKDVTTEISKVHRWKLDAFTAYGFELILDDEITLMLVVRFIGEDSTDIRLFREWGCDVAQDFQDATGLDVFSFTEENEDFEENEDSFGTDIVDEDLKENEEHGDTNLKNFSLVHEGEEDEGELEYGIKNPFPFWNVAKNDGATVALCEYGALESEDDPIPNDYWAKYALLEWYAYVGDQGSEGLVTLWFGWDIELEDVDTLEK